MKITYKPSYKKQVELMLRIYLNRDDSEKIDYMIINPQTIIARHEAGWVTIQLKSLIEYFFCVHH